MSSQVHPARGVPVAEAADGGGVLAGLDVEELDATVDQVRLAAHLNGLVVNGHARQGVVHLGRDHRVVVAVALRVPVDRVGVVHRGGRVAAAGDRRDDVLDVSGGDHGVAGVGQAGVLEGALPEAGSAVAAAGNLGRSERTSGRDESDNRQSEQVERTYFRHQGLLTTALQIEPKSV